MNSKVYLHIIGWILFIITQEVDFSLVQNWDLSDYCLTASKALVRMITFYFVYLFVWPKFLKVGKWPQLIAGVVLGLLLFPLLRYLIEEVLFLHLLGTGNYSDPKSWFYLNNNLWWYALPTVSTSALVFLFEKSQRDKAKQMELQKEKTDAELAYLRAQINPHFLFNTLHFLHTEAFEKNPALAETILKVSSIIRYSVESSKEGKRPISKEVELINNYIDIFRKRYEGCFFLNFDYSKNGLEKMVEPLLLIPFVENAFKHGQFSDPEHPIAVNLSITPTEIKFQVSNKIKNQQKDAGHGIGIDNVKRRLEVLYPDQYELLIQKDDKNYKVVLTLAI